MSLNVALFVLTHILFFYSSERTKSQKTPKAKEAADARKQKRASKENKEASNCRAAARGCDQVSRPDVSTLQSSHSHRRKRAASETFHRMHRDLCEFFFFLLRNGVGKSRGTLKSLKIFLDVRWCESSELSKHSLMSAPQPKL